MDGTEGRVSDWGSIPIGDLFSELGTGEGGLTSAEASRRLAARGVRTGGGSRFRGALATLASQFRSPITLILIAAAGLSMFLENGTDAAILLSIVAMGAALGFWQEYSASNALSALLATVKARTTVWRDGALRELGSEEVAPGDVLWLSAGSTIPADCRLLEARDLFVNEAALTGESFPVEKRPGETPAGSPAGGRWNVVFRGSHVVSGTGRALAARTGEETEFGRISGRLRLRAPETDFERGVRRFGNLLLEVTLLLTLGIFVIHLATGRPALDALLFSMALAVGLTPQLLPAVISVNLASGARRLAARRVIVRRLASIENFGGMEVLCCDKTGTLTEGRVEVEGCVDFEGRPHGGALRLAALNARFETGFANPIDEALRRRGESDSESGSGSGSDAEKLDEIPYDFSRKRLSVLVRTGGRRLLIAKGALPELLSVCADAETADGSRASLEEARDRIGARFEELGRSGRRAIGVAYRELDRDRADRGDEAGLTFAGLVALRDPPREGIAETVARLGELGVSLKIVTGDNRIVAASVAERVGLDGGSTLTGAELRGLTDEALMIRAAGTSVFAEIEPNQKERIVLALKRSGQVVGYMGDGINDATALRAADVGISVDGAADVAREAADIVLLDRDLNALTEGVRGGRATFANTMKYILVATSANFGNMFSMAGASTFLPFLPLLPKQILLTNLLTDLPETTIAGDRVEAEATDRPQRWDIGLIRRFMVVFGLLSSVFDYATFGVLIWGLGAGPEEFRTGWFVESVVSACAVVLIVRSRGPLTGNPPSRALFLTTAAVIGATIALPYTRLAGPLGFAPPSAGFLGAMLGLVAAYAVSAEFAKRWFYRRVA